MNIDTEAQARDYLIDLGISEQSLRIATNINGYNMETLESVLYSEYGYRDFNQFEQESN